MNLIPVDCSTEEAGFVKETFLGHRIIFFSPGLSLARPMYRLALFWFFLLVAKYRLAYTSSRRICTVSLILFGLYTDWLRTGSRHGYIQIGYIEVLALAVYNLAIYIPLLCTLQTEEPGAPGFQVRSEAHRNSVDSGMHRLHGGTSWRESSLKFISLSRQKTSVRTRSVRTRPAGHTDFQILQSLREGPARPKKETNTQHYIRSLMEQQISLEAQ